MTDSRNRFCNIDNVAAWLSIHQPPLNMAGEPTYPDELERAILTTYWPLGFDGVKGDMTRSGKVECQEEQQVAEERTHLDVRWIVGCLTTVATMAMVMAMRRCKEMEDCSTRTLMRNLSSTCARPRALLFHG
ncbi:hypothetical protein HBH92_247400 [Parastagonospora nodorum]|nr:hypothetical protein HBI04_246300 [Parastagonospora nodorum]KAH4399737.1 hypothetical protein HBH92_247400 [Parastagonospora nodorum]KAH4426861.1 hypothetical protein HBH91_248600 [Parastagonospora nodorum]KAH4472589.1 hypothetical protein HBH89_254470 [Parastagonospora nodorum]KAH4522083.1 hypothetical protein HBH86_248130 [Parastagonospora nodorum]